MTTTNLSEKERKIRKNLRIKETLERDGNTWFSPQMKLLGMWFYFDEHTTSWTNLVFTTYFKRYSLNVTHDENGLFSISKENNMNLVFNG